MSDSRTVLPTANRWLQLAIGIVCMVMIANLQYRWTLFVTPIDQKLPLGPRLDPGGVQHLCAYRDMAGADRRLVRRSLRAKDCRDDRRLLVPLGNVLMAATGSWHAVFVIGAIMNAVAAVMVLAVLKPLRTAHQAAYASGRAAQA